MKTKFLLATLFIVLGSMAFGQNLLYVQNDISDQYDLEITYEHNGNQYVTLVLINITTSIQNFNVGSGNEIISFRIRPADCYGPWAEFDYTVSDYGFTNFCLGCDDPNFNYIEASIAYNKASKLIGIKCTE